jgi:DNA-binding NtrC family response regulator
MQVKLLRVLETREFMRVGGTETIKVDIRLVAATNADLEAAVERGAFRNDLYYRLKVVTLRIPPLRERREDIPLLANHFLSMFAKENERDGMKFAPDALRAIVNARWEGNVRELRNVVESLVVLTPATEIRVADLPEELKRFENDEFNPNSEEATVAGPLPTGAGSSLTMDEIERQAILAALDRTGGNRTQAAELLGIGLRTLQRKLKEYKVAGGAEAES